MQLNTKTVEQRIREGFFKKHRAGDVSDDFVAAIYELFSEFASYYTPEWNRLEDNERVYHGDSWSKSPYATQKVEDDTNAPKPSDPIIHTAVESVTADILQEEPEIVIHPDATGSKISAQVLARVANQELSSCRFGAQWKPTIHDILVGGWTVFESGFDPDMNIGNGGTYIRNVVNTNFMCDPETVDIQEGRACFKFVRRPRDWFAQRFPDQYDYMTDDLDIQSTDTYSAITVPTSSDKRLRMIEMWVRIYNPKTNKHQVHFVQVAGHQVLYNSADDYPNGYYDHGEYPFVVIPLFPEKGSALGFGIVDLYKDQQRYADKLDQFILKNAFLASANRLLNTDASGFKDEDLADWSKEIVHGDQIGGLQWFDTKPLPGYLFDYVLMKRQGIKEGSGANDQAQGKTGNGVTAKSAIAALQEMATKRSRGTAAVLHEGFKVAARQMLAVLRQHTTMTREVTVILEGHEFAFNYDKTQIKPKMVDGKVLTKSEYESFFRVIRDGLKKRELPIEYFVDVKTARQTEYDKMANNELVYELMARVPNADPVLMLELLDIPDKERYIEKIRLAQQGGMMALQQQNAQLQEALKQQEEQLQAAEESRQAATAIMASKQPQAAAQPAQTAQKTA